MTDTNNIKKLRDIIENMNKIHQIHILKILKENDIQFTENSNGIFVNMSLLNKKTLNRIKKFIKYVHLQEEQLENVEDIKAKYQEEFYKDNKEDGAY
jgi:hypothetical protein